MTLAEIISAAGPLSDTILQIASNEDGTASVITESAHFLLHASGSRIVIEAGIEAVIPTPRERVLSALLAYNAVWQDTGMIRMALSGTGADAQALLIADLIIDTDFTSERFAAVITDLDRKVQIWSEIIANGVEDASAIHGNQHSLKV
ncbi:MAG: type III secretion system chaperone [Pseudomonadota bacterium]